MPSAEKEVFRLWMAGFSNMGHCGYAEGSCGVLGGDGGVVEDFLEEAELEIGRKKKAFQWGHLFSLPGAVQAASCHGAEGERCGAVVPVVH